MTNTKPERTTLILDSADKAKLAELAQADASGSATGVIRRLIREAYAHAHPQPIPSICIRTACKQPFERSAKWTSRVCPTCVKAQEKRRDLPLPE